MEHKGSKYKPKDQVSFERRKMFGNSLTRGIIISCRFFNYSWTYLVECCDDKKMVVVSEDELWLLDERHDE